MRVCECVSVCASSGLEAAAVLLPAAGRRVTRRRLAGLRVEAECGRVAG